MIKHSPLASVSFRLATPDDAHLETYDFTKLTSINTCPTWGVLRYQMHKSMIDPGTRAMALEAGVASHDVFAAVRLWTLRDREDLFNTHGLRLFGRERFDSMRSDWAAAGREDARRQLLAFALGALHTSGFYDDPSDRRRTLSNLEEACIAYCDRYDFTRPVYVSDQGLVGIELAFDIVVVFTPIEGVPVQARFVGKIDGIHTSKDGSYIEVQENKTASRLNDAWRMMFAMSHQVTGYCVAASVLTEQHIDKAKVIGLAIPLPKAHDYGGYVVEPCTRPPHMIGQWTSWFYHSLLMFRAYKDTPIIAPKYTHSCNRYFSTCSMLPFCNSDDADKQDMLNEMYTDEWSPLKVVNEQVES